MSHSLTKNTKSISTVHYLKVCHSSLMSLRYPINNIVNNELAREEIQQIVRAKVLNGNNLLPD